MKSKPPADRRKFASAWDEIGYLYDKLLYWLYERADGEKARAFAKRLEQLLPKVTREHDGIFGEECWSLLYEAKGNLAKAIEHRENEIRLIRRLHEISHNAQQERLVLKQYGYADLSDRLDLLAVLYHDSGNLEEALSTLWESKRLCEKHGIKFDGDDMLQEYLEEKRTFPKESGGRIGAGMVSSQRKRLI
jgi:tetratricopeptide (TPR) repeat protein